MKAFAARVILAMALPTIAISPAWAQSDQGTPAAPPAPEAQPSAPPAAGTPSGDIIVTARRRAENIEKVPISITAIGGEALRTRSIFSDTDLQTAVPGLTIRQNGSSNQYTYAIRGQSIDTYTNSPPAVLPYIDEVQIVTHSANPLYDLEGIQVLKGPQGTLFGRNTTGGAILFQTVKPDDKFDGYVLGRYGNFNSRHVEGAVSIPVNDKIAFRIAGDYTGGGAFVYNIASHSHLGDQDLKSIRGTMVLKPFDGFTNTTVVQYTHEGGNNLPSEAYTAYACGDTFHGNSLFCGAAFSYSPGNANFDAWVAAHPNIYPNGVLDFTALQRKRGPWVSDVNVPLFHRAHSIFVINTTNYELSPTLTLKNIFGYNNTRADDGFDYDGTPYPIFQIGGTPSADATTVVNPKGFIQGTKQFSDEFQLQGKAFDNRLVYVIGAYYSNQRNLNDSNLYAFDYSPVPTNPAATDLAFAYDMTLRDISKAVFAQGTYKLTDQLNLTGGFRYTWDSLSAQQGADSVFGPHPTEHTSASNPSWTVSLDYQMTPSLLLYVTQRGSWRTGGYNYNVNPINNTADNDNPALAGNRFLPETTKDVEVGFKYSGRGLGIPVTFNADAYNQWVSNIQRALYVIGTGGSPNLFTDNVPAAEITGFEFDTTVRPAPWLTLGASAAYTDARYTKANVLIQGVFTHYGPFADAPKWSGNLFFDLTGNLGGNAGKLLLHTEVYAQSKLYFSNVAATVAPGTTIKGYALVNARLSWNDMFGSKISSAVYVRNLLDKKYYAGGNAVGPSLGINTSVAGQPRMFGGELRFDF